MAKNPSRRTYLQLVGEISVRWNYLERMLNVFGWTYLGGDAETAARIFGAMGNVSKTDFISYLIDRREPNQGLAKHGHHFLKAYNIIRENRNYIEHASPSLDIDESYLGEIARTDKRGLSIFHSATVAELRQLIADMETYQNYGLRVSTGADKGADEIPAKDGRTLRDVIASLDKPPLPRKLETLPRPIDRIGEKPPPRSSRAKGQKQRRPVSPRLT